MSQSVVFFFVVLLGAVHAEPLVAGEGQTVPVPVHCPAVGADVHGLEGLDLPPAQFAVHDEVLVVVLLLLPDQVLEVEAGLGVGLDEVDGESAVGTGGVVAPPVHHALEAELVAAGEFARLLLAVPKADRALVLVG